MSCHFDIYFILYHTPNLSKWEDDVKSDITGMKITNWKDCIRDRSKWKILVEKAKTSLKFWRLRKKKKNLSNYSKYVAVTPTTSVSTDTLEP